MREFILRASKTVTNPNYINLNDLPGAGRLDLVCRCITNALFISHAIRKDSAIHVVLEGPNYPPKTISFYGKEVKSLSPDERNVASHIKIALEKGKNLKLNESVESEPGIIVSKKSFESIVKEKASTSELIYLHPKGIDIRKFKFGENVVFVIGDSSGLPQKSEKLLERLNAKKVSIGPLEYFASQAITVCHVELDRSLLNF
jgi:tRNA (pseudouridine54-N1)-methyltransferase